MGGSNECQYAQRVFLLSESEPIMKKQRLGGILNMAFIAGKIGGIASSAHYPV